MKKGQVVEFGDAQRVMSDPRHDYTKLLLSSIPTTRARWRPRKKTLGADLSVAPGRH
jgi:peptide/nickel transport system ATP-binding protein